MTSLPDHSDLSFIMHSACRLSLMQLCSSLTALWLRIAWLEVFSPVSLLRCRALRLETDEGMCPSSLTLTHASFVATCEYLACVLPASPCLQHLAFHRLLCHLLTWHFNFLFQPAQVKDLQCVFLFLSALKKSNILKHSAGGNVHKLTLNLSNVLAFQLGLGLNLSTTVVLNIFLFHKIHYIPWLLSNGYLQKSPFDPQLFVNPPELSFSKPGLSSDSDQHTQ